MDVNFKFKSENVIFWHSYLTYFATAANEIDFFEIWWKLPARSKIIYKFVI